MDFFYESVTDEQDAERQTCRYVYVSHVALSLINLFFVSFPWIPIFVAGGKPR